MAIGTVSTWNLIDGWGVIESRETPGGCFVHYSVLPTIRADGYRELHEGQRVEFDFEEREQDGYAYAATLVY